MIEVPITARQQYQQSVSYVSRGFCIDRAGRMNHRAASRSARERPARSQSPAKSVRSLTICSRCWRDKTVATTSSTAPSAKANEVGSGTEGGPVPNSGGTDIPLNWSDICARHAKPPILGENKHRTSVKASARETSHRHARHRRLNTKTSAGLLLQNPRSAPGRRRLRRSARQISSPLGVFMAAPRAGGSARRRTSDTVLPCPIRPSCLVSARTIARAGRRAPLESGVIVQ